ncbi:MAG: threonine--tRNA ligase [Candidatus Paceibacterota bacterium]
MTKNTNENEHLSHLRHSLAHLLAAAVSELWPGTKNTIGPVIDNGFYYDFDFTTPISDKDLKDIEKKMKKILPTWKEFTHKEVILEEAKEIFKDNPYKLELINEIASNGEKISLYTFGEFTDLCRGGHAENPSKEINSDSFKLSHTAGAYWRGDEKNKMLTRIYGLAFETKEKLEEYEKLREEAEKRDHRKLGKELSIFAFDNDVGAGLPLWLPNGGAMIEELEKLAKETEFAYEYERVKTPHIAKESMYLTSGHLPYYEDTMFPPMEYEGGKYYLKAMNCPHHHKIFAAEPRSYKQLPLRLAEYGSCYRHEKSGELFGIMRVRSMQMNDAHIYCTEEQFFDEFKKVIEMYLYYFKIFGVDKYTMRLSKHSKENLGKKYIDEPKLWIKTEDMVRKCLVDLNVPFVEAENEAAFYGPKIDVQIWSVIGREFTLATNQVDFAVPARFKLVYTDNEGKEKTPLCIHRAPLATHERFIGFLIEHYGGNFPLWLAPEQVAVIPVKESNFETAKDVYKKLRALQIRAKIDLTNSNFGKKVRSAKDMRTPYMVIIGDKDMEAGVVTLEHRDKGKIGTLTLDKLADLLVKEIKNRE